MTAGLILAAGLVAADVLRRLIASRTREGLDAPDLVSQVVYYVAAALAVTLASQQLGLATDLLASLIVTATAAITGGVALAFALGSTPLFRDLLARHYAARLYRRGDVIAVDGVAGELLRFGPTTAILRGDDGEIVVPCATLMGGVVALQREVRSSSADDPGDTPATGA